MATEYPPLGKSYVLSYSNDDKSFPIVAIKKDPRVDNYRRPDDLSPHPEPARYPNHRFTSTQPTNTDERVIWVYEILPAPYVPFTRYDDDLGPVQGRRRFVANTGQEASLERDKKVTYEAREGSAIVSTEIEETWDAGSTDPDLDSPFPIKDRDFYDPSRGPVQERRQLVSTTGNEVATLENKDGVITQTSYEAYNEFLSFKVVQTYSVDGPQLVGKATDNDGQLVTVTTQRKGADNYTPPSPTATRTVEVNREDAESLVERIVDTPEVFKANTFSVERPDPIPQKFRVAVPIQSSQEIVEGDAEVPILEEGEISKSEEQRNKFIKRISSTSRDQAVLPQTLTGKSTNNERQEVTVTETLQLGNTAEAPTATTTIESEALGDGNYVITKTSVPNVFSALTLSRERPDPVPQKFRVTVPISTREENLQGTAQEPTLTVGQISKSEQQVNQFVKRISTTARDVAQLPRSVTQKLTTNEGLLATVTETLQTGDTTAVPTSKRTVESEALGDGTYVVRVTESPKVFSAKTFRAEKEDLTPQKFRAKQSDLTTEENIEGTATQPTLGEDQFLKSEQQINEFVKRVTTNNRITELNANLNESVITPEGQLATRTITLSKSAQTLVPSATVVDGDIEELGDGRTVKTEVKVSQVFDGKQESLEKPEVIPPEFRASLQNRTISEVKTGQAISLPSLSQDELSKTIQRVTEHKIRETKVTRPSSSYPSLTGELVDNDQIKVTRTRTVAKTNQTITPSATVSGTVEALGDGFTLKTQDTKAKVFAAKTFSQEKPDNIPVEFRAEKPVKIEEFTEEGKAQEVSLADNEISKSEQQVTEFLKRTRTATRDIVGNVTLEGGSQIDQDGVKVTVVRTLSDGSQDISPSALVSGSVEAIGDGKTIKTELTKAKVFDQDQTTLSQTVQVPAKFIDREQEQESYVEEEQTATPEPLGDAGFGVVESSAQRVSEFTVRKNLRTINGVNNITEKQLNNSGQEVTIESSISNDPAIETGAKVEIARTQGIGGGKFLKEIGRVDEVFDAKQETLSQSVQIPAKFLDEKVTETSLIEEGAEAVPDEVGSDGFGITQSSAQRVNAFTVRKTKTEQSGVTSLTEKQLNNEGQEVTVESSISNSAVVETGATVEFSRAQAIGGGKFVTEVGRVETVFDGKQKTIRQDVQIPAKFLDGSQDQESFIEEGTDSEPDDLGVGGSGIIESTAQRITEHKVRKSTVTQEIVTSVTENQTNNAKQKITVTSSIVDNPTVTSSATTEFVRTQAIGGGKYVKEEGTVEEVFPNKSFSKQVPDPAPEKFRIEIPALTEEITEESSDVTEADVELGDNDLEKNVQQVDSFTKRTRTTSRDAASNGVLVGQQTGEWGLVTVTETYDENETIEVGHTILSNRKTPLGGGKFLGEKVQVDSPIALTETKKDAETGVVFTTTKTLVAAGTELPSVGANEVAEITPIDAYNSILIVTSVSSLPADETFETSIDVSYPDVLETVGIDWESSTGGNSASSGVRSISDIVADDLAWQSSANATASARIVGSVFTRIRKGHRGTVRARVTRSYSFNPPTSIPTITKFNPVYGTVTIKGTGVKRTKKNSVGGFGDTLTGSASGGGFDIDNFASSVQFGPFCHSSPSLQNPTPPSGASANFTASGGSVPAGEYPATSAQATATASAQLQLSASSPLGSSLATGFEHVAAVKVEKWRFGIWIQEVYTAIHP